MDTKVLMSHLSVDTTTWSMFTHFHIHVCILRFFFIGHLFRAYFVLVYDRAGMISYTQPVAPVSLLDRQTSIASLKTEQISVS